MRDGARACLTHEVPYVAGHDEENEGNSTRVTTELLQFLYSSCGFVEVKCLVQTLDSMKRLSPRRFSLLGAEGDC